jgi:hypothetical protein
LFNLLTLIQRNRIQTMPFAQIYMMEGRTEEQKRAVIEKVSAALVEATGAPIRQRARLDSRCAQGKLGHRRRQRQRFGALAAC